MAGRIRRHRRDTCTGSSVLADRSGTRSTACRMAGRSRRRSARPGPSVGGRRTGTSRSVSPRPGCATRLTRRAAERCRGWSGPARHSPTLPPSTCATSSTTAGASRRPCAATGRRSTRICCRRSARWPIEDVTTDVIERWLAGFDGSRTRREQAADPASRDPRGGRSKVYGADGERGRRGREVPARSAAATIEVFSPEEVWALVRAAGSEQDAAHVPDGRVHRPADGGAAGAALARRRLRRLASSGCGRATTPGS